MMGCGDEQCCSRLFLFGTPPDSQLLLFFWALVVTPSFVKPAPNQFGAGSDEAEFPLKYWLYAFFLGGGSRGNLAFWHKLCVCSHSKESFDM